MLRGLGFLQRAVSSLSVCGTKSTPISTSGKKNPPETPRIHPVDQKGIVHVVFPRVLQMGLVLLEHTSAAIWLARCSGTYSLQLDMYMSVLYKHRGAPLATEYKTQLGNTNNERFWIRASRFLWDKTITP